MGKNKKECLAKNKKINEEQKEKDDYFKAVKLYEELGKNIFNFWESLTEEEKQELNDVQTEGTDRKSVV